MLYAISKCILFPKTVVAILTPNKKQNKVIKFKNGSSIKIITPAKKWHIYEVVDAQKQKSILFDSAEKAVSMGGGDCRPDEENITNKTFDSLYHIGARITVL